MVPPLDLVGKRFGRLIVIRRGPSTKHGQARWYAICDCNPEVEILRNGQSLITQHTMSCGCLRKMTASLTFIKPIAEGTRFGKLVVLNLHLGSRNRQPKKLAYRVKCDCGNICEVLAEKLRNGRTQSCGCWNRQIKETAAFQVALSRYTQGAKSRNLEWALTNAEFLDFTQKRCFYCDSPPSNRSSVRDVPSSPSSKREFIYSGIDRKNSHLGYTLENCVPCCAACNRAKMAVPYDEFIRWAHRVSDHLRKLQITGVLPT